LASLTALVCIHFFVGGFMSVEAFSWALNDAPCDSPTQKLVLLALANHARPDGSSAFPSVSTIRRYTLLSERAIREKLVELESLGVIWRSDPRVVAAYISRADKRPQGWNLNLTLRVGVQEAQVAVERGAPDDTSGVQEDTQRGAGGSERGACAAPKPYITVNEPYIENNSEASRLCRLLAGLIFDNGSPHPKITPKWLADMDRLMRLDGRSVEQVEACIRWCQSNSFWRANIHSPHKLREKYDTMRLQASRVREQAEPTGFDGIRGFLSEQD